MHPFVKNYPHIRLNPEQAAKIMDALKDHNEPESKRPGIEYFQKISAELEAIPAPDPKSPIPGTTVIPEDPNMPWHIPVVSIDNKETFEVPEGIAIIEFADLTGKHSVNNAGTSFWLHMWTYWNILGQQGRQDFVTYATRHQTVA
jgi:hypothetical protein